MILTHDGPEWNGQGDCSDDRYISNVAPAGGNGWSPAPPPAPIDWAEVYRFLQLIGRPGGDDGQLVFAAYPPGGKGSRHFIAADLASIPLQQIQARLTAEPTHSLGVVIHAPAPQPTDWGSLPDHFHWDDGPLKAWGAQNHHIARFVGGYSECDGGLPIDDQLALPARAGLPPPSLIIFTGGKSIHFYWLLKPGETFTDHQLARRLQKALAAAIEHVCPEAGVDKGISSSSHVMRCPGGYHPKTGQSTRIIEADGPRYSAADLLNLTEWIESKTGTKPPPPREPRPPAEPLEFTADGSDRNPNASKWFDRCGRLEQLELAASILQFIPPRGAAGSGTYDRALAAVAALAGHFGADGALHVIDRAGWDDPAAAADWNTGDKVADLAASSRTGIGALISAARARGWEHPHADRIEQAKAGKQRANGSAPTATPMLPVPDLKGILAEQQQQEAIDLLQLIPPRAPGSDTRPAYLRLLWGLAALFGPEQAGSLMSSHSPAWAAEEDLTSKAHEAKSEFNPNTFFWIAKHDFGISGSFSITVRDASSIDDINRLIGGTSAADDKHSTYAKGEAPVDLRAAEILQAESGDTIACHQDAFFIYNPAAGYWSRVSADAMKRRALDVLKRIYVMVKIEATEVESFRFGSARQVDDTVRALRSVAGLGPLDRRSPPHVVVFTNGTYNLRTDTLGPHSPDHGATYAVAGPFVPDALCPPEVEHIITTCFPDEAEPILQALFRWVIDPTIRYGEAFHLLGGTGTGKGLILTVVQHLLPPELVSTLSHPADLKGPEQLYQFTLGRRLLLFPDCPAKMPRYAEHLGPWYELVENKPQSLRRLHGSDTDARRLHCRSIIASVSPLKLSDSRDGAQRRLLTLESLPRSGAPDPTLYDDISGNTNRQRQMLGELASWALLMPLDEVNAVLSKNDRGGLLTSSAAAVAVESDTVGQWIDSCLMPHTGGPNAEVTDADWKEMFRSYLGWCKAVNVSYGMQFSNFHGQVRRTLGVARCQPRRKETSAEALAAGRERRHLPRIDAGFELRAGLLRTTSGGEGFAFDHLKAGSGGLAQIAELPPIALAKQASESPGPEAGAPPPPAAGCLGQGLAEPGPGLGQGLGQGWAKAVQIADSASSAGDMGEPEGVGPGLNVLLSHNEEKKGSIEHVSPARVICTHLALAQPEAAAVENVSQQPPEWLPVLQQVAATYPDDTAAELSDRLWSGFAIRATEAEVIHWLAAWPPATTNGPTAGHRPYPSVRVTTRRVRPLICRSPWGCCWPRASWHPSAWRESGAPPSWASTAACGRCEG